MPGSRRESGASASRAIPSAPLRTIRLPRTAFPVDLAPEIRTPLPSLPAITFRAQGTDPPITLPGESTIATPLPAFDGPLVGSPLPPPRTFPSTRLVPPPSIRMPSPVKPWIRSPRIVLEPARSSSPCAGWLNRLPSSSTSGIGSLPFGRAAGPASRGRVASITTGSVIAGRAASRAIEWGPGPGISKRMRSGPSWLPVALASRMACVREPGPESLVLVTKNVRRAAASVDFGGASPALERAAGALSPRAASPAPMRTPPRGAGVYHTSQATASPHRSRCQRSCQGPAAPASRDGEAAAGGRISSAFTSVRLPHPGAAAASSSRSSVVVSRCSCSGATDSPGISAATGSARASRIEKTAAAARLASCRAWADLMAFSLGRWRLPVLRLEVDWTATRRGPAM